MYTYFNKRTGEFIEQESKTKSTDKILINAEILERTKAGTYGKLEGQYYSVIDDIVFYWDDLHKKITNPDNDIVVFILDESFAFINR